MRDCYISFVNKSEVPDSVSESCMAAMQQETQPEEIGVKTFINWSIKQKAWPEILYFVLSAFPFLSVRESRPPPVKSS